MPDSKQYSSPASFDASADIDLPESAGSITVRDMPNFDAFRSRRDENAAVRNTVTGAICILALATLIAAVVFSLRMLS